MVYFFYMMWHMINQAQLAVQDVLNFWDRKSRNRFFFNFYSQNFVSNLNDDCYQLSFEVYNVFVAQKLPISEFLIEFFSPGHWPLWQPPEAAISTSATSTGYQILAKDLSFCYPKMNLGEVRLHSLNPGRIKKCVINHLFFSVCKQHNRYCCGLKYTNCDCRSPYFATESELSNCGCS